MNLPYFDCQILKDDNPLLREVSRPADTGLAHHRTIGRRLLATVKEKKALGIAAPQVGLLQRIIVVDTTASQAPGIELIMFNPEIISSEGSKKNTEGCLSLPGKSVVVKRKKRIKVRYQDIEGNEIVQEFRNLQAIVVQHEIDHLNGKLMTDYA